MICIAVGQKVCIVFSCPAKPQLPEIQKHATFSVQRDLHRKSGMVVSNDLYCRKEGKDVTEQEAMEDELPIPTVKIGCAFRLR